MRSISDGPDAIDLPGFFQPAGANASVEDVVTHLAFAAGATFGADREGFYRLKWLDPDVFARGPGLHVQRPRLSGDRAPTAAVWRTVERLGYRLST